jgi:hypothetical protein
MPSSPRARLWRRILIATGSVVALAAAVAWLALPAQYEAFALLKVSGRQPSILEKGTAPADEFVLFKATQAQLVAGNMVATGVLRDAKVNRLESVQQHVDDPITWLQNDLVVNFPGDAEIMRVAIRTERPQDSIELVDKVVAVYLNEVVANDRQRQLAEEAKLATAYEKQNADYQAALGQLSAMERFHKTKGSEVAQLKKRLAIESLESELAKRRRLLDQLDETELEQVLDEARAAMPPESRTADAPPAPADGSGKKDALPNAVLLRKKVEFLDTKLSETDARIEKATQEIAGLEIFSAQVAAKQEELEAKRKIKNELGSLVDRIRVERLASSRIMPIQQAVLENESGDAVRRNVLFGSLAAGGLTLLALGLAIGRPRNSGGKTNES